MQFSHETQSQNSTHRQPQSHLFNCVCIPSFPLPLYHTDPVSQLVSLVSDLSLCPLSTFLSFFLPQYLPISLRSLQCHQFVYINVRYQLEESIRNKDVRLKLPPPSLQMTSILAKTKKKVFIWLHHKTYLLKCKMSLHPCCSVGWSVTPVTETLQVWSSVPRGSNMYNTQCSGGGNQSKLLSHIDASLSLFFTPFLLL